MDPRGGSLAISRVASLSTSAEKTAQAYIAYLMIVSATHCTDQPVRALGIRIVNKPIFAMNNPKSRCFQFGGGEIRGQHVVSDLLVARALRVRLGRLSIITRWPL